MRNMTNKIPPRNTMTEKEMVSQSHYDDTDLNHPSPESSNVREGNTLIEMDLEVALERKRNLREMEKEY